MFEYKGIEYKILVEKKNIKNMYLRINDDMTLHITCNIFTTKKMIEKFVNDNYKSICKMIDKKLMLVEKKEKFYYLGKEYNIIYGDYKEIFLDDNNIYCINDIKLNKWLIQETKRILSSELEKCISNTEEIIPKNITLYIRKMKTRWGVCNRSNNKITLNSDLIRYEISTIDYVIYHEIAHFTHPNHQSGFWKLVSKYVPNYKEERNKLKY